VGDIIINSLKRRINSMDEKIIVQKNEKFNGLEIKFPSKPEADVLAFLKS
jgi:spore cortex formation protein SpoVR/YcgB (stage V sporulation)